MTRLSLGRDTAGHPVALALRFANRHALVTGATGKGKSSTVATMAEGFSRAGVPSVVLDVKGDLGGLARANPVRLLDPFAGAPLNLFNMGPDLISRALDLSDAQAGAVDVAFAYAEQIGAPLADLGDLRRLLAALTANRDSVSEEIGLVSASSLAAVQRAALRLERDAAGAFGSPGLDVAGFEAFADDGRGRITVLDCARLMQTPGLYGALCAFILSDLFKRCPEVGDLDRPRLAVFLDESHLIFADAAPALTRSLESAVRLIRSKGVALIFASQSPADLPASIAGQLQNRIQHGLHGVTPADQRAIRAAADSLPSAKGFRAADVIGSLGVGVALVSLVQADGTPGQATVTRISPPTARLGRLSPVEWLAVAPEPISPTPARPAAEPWRDPEPEEAETQSRGSLMRSRFALYAAVMVAAWTIGIALQAAAG